MISGLRPYPRMKHSGDDGLSVIPEHWGTRRLHTVAEMRVSNVDKHSKEGEAAVRLCNYVDVYYHDRIHPKMSFMEATATPEEIRKFRLQCNDVLITKDSEAWDDIGVPALVGDVGPDTLCGYHLALLRPNVKLMKGGYLFRALQSRGVAVQLYVRANGVTRYGLSQNAIKSTLVPLPPLPDQTAIARFLDHKDRRIQKYIRAKEKLIALLDEYKQALIHQAVTGQIDVRTGEPHPEYKESGLEWIGRVPKDWEVVRLKRHAACSSGGSIAPSKFSAEIDPSDPLVNVPVIGGNGVMGRCSRSNIDLNVLAIGRVGALCGNVHLVCPPAWITDNALVLRLNDDQFELRYLAEALELRNLNDLANQSAQPLVTGSEVRNQQIPCPPQTEQRAIGTYLDRLSGSMDSATGTARRHCDLMHEYRTRLIADVVTGKLDIREAAAGLPELDLLDDDVASDTLSLNDTLELDEVTAVA